MAQPDKAKSLASKHERVLILGAAGRDFHTFNVCFRDHPNYDVVAFTAAQIPGIVGVGQKRSSAIAK